MMMLMYNEKNKHYFFFSNLLCIGLMIMIKESAFRGVDLFKCLHCLREVYFESCVLPRKSLSEGAVYRIETIAQN